MMKLGVFGIWYVTTYDGAFLAVPQSEGYMLIIIHNELVILGVQHKLHTIK